MMPKSVLAWHFVGDRLRNGDPVPPDGEWLQFGGPLVLCKSGLHASRKLVDALNYAPGNTICRVRCEGRIVEEDDKLVCARRKILWRINDADVLWAFSRWSALQVVELWNAPEVVREYLTSGDPNLKAKAWAAAVSAVEAATWAAWAAGGSAAWTAARDAQNRQLTNMVMRQHRKKTDVAKGGLKCQRKSRGKS